MVDFTGSYGSITNLLLNNFTSVYCIFTDANGVAVDVNNVSGQPSIVVTDTGKDPSDSTRIVVSSALTAVGGGQTGYYGYQLKPRDLETGYYHILFTGDLQTVSPPVTLSIEGGVKVSAATVEDDLIFRIRLKLKDVNVRLYRIDLPIEIWTDEEILYALQEALGQMNATPPMRLNWSFSAVYSYGHGADALLVRSAFAHLLESKAVLEAANTMTKSDGAANLTIQRSQIYSSIANNVMNDATRKIEGWKRSLVPGLYGQGTTQYPFQLRRAISFLPGFKNIFS